MLANQAPFIRSARAIAGLLLCLAILPTSARADDATPTDLVKAQLLANVQTYAPGSSFMLGVHLKMKPHWHTYWVNPGESGEPTKVKITAPPGVEVGQVQWPLPRAIESFGAITYGYEDEVLLLIPVKVVATKERPIVINEDGSCGLTFDAHVSWLACNDTCIEGEAKLKLMVPLSKEAPANEKLFKTWQARVPMAKDDKAAAIMEKVEQAKAGDGSVQPALTLTWKEAPAKVEWFPISTRAVAVESPVVKHEGKTTRIQFKVNVFQPDRIPGDTVQSLVIFEDAKGNRQGVMVPFKVVTSVD